MTYVRKTKDIWVTQQDYGNGWEDVTYACTMEEGKQDYHDYINNTNYPTRLIKRRVKIN